ncbi:MAG: tetratricopeptide repeat protein [candidate division Zixibacteria bacterium]|nr:tetratricopeptide repeat protein [candidate division Zixibacteria bacterium]
MYIKTLILLLLVVLAVGCSQSFYSQGRKHLDSNRYSQAIDAFYSEIGKHPSSMYAWRELGVAFYKKGEYTQAEEALKQAAAIEPDSRTHLFLGLVYEAQELWDHALDAYAASLSLKPDGKTAVMTRAHIDLLMSKRIAREVAAAIENEASIDVEDIPTHTIAVSDFDGSLLPTETMPLARGLAEFVSIDLAKVRSLAVVERQKISAIMDELKLSTTGYVDSATVPRVGKLLGAHKLVTGSVLNIGDEGLRLDGTVVKTATGSQLAGAATEGELQKLFQMEKDFVFSIIAQLGITLSRAERDDIEEVPTESYLAFLAYSRGLEYQSMGMHDAARQEFDNALEYDAGFEEAGIQSESEAAAADVGSFGNTYDWLAGTSPDGDDMGTTDSGIDDYLASQPDMMGATEGSAYEIVAESEPLPGGTGTVIVEGNLDAQ